MLRPRHSVLWIALNLAGVILYVYFGMALWVQPGEEGLPGGPGDAFYWILTQVPLAIVFLLLNVVALCIAFLRIRKTLRFTALYI